MSVNDQPMEASKMLDYTPSYSVQPTGQRARLMATAAGTTRVIVTLTPDVAQMAATELATLADDRLVDLHLESYKNPGQICYRRRHLMAAVTAADVTDAGTEAVTGLARVAAQCSEAERRALADEVGRLYEGTEDIIVPAALRNDYAETDFVVIANAWLTQEVATASASAAAEYLVDLVDPDGEGYALYEGLLAHLRTTDAAINAHADTHPVDVTIDHESLAAWLRRHLPAAAAQVDELVDELPEAAPYNAFGRS